MNILNSEAVGTIENLLRKRKKIQLEFNSKTEEIKILELNTKLIKGGRNNEKNK